MGRGQIKFKVPLFGYSIMVSAERGIMADRQIGLHSFRAEENPPDCLRTKIELLNTLIDAGMPWSALASCRHAPGQFGALIEAADNRLLECAGEQHAA